MAPTVLWIGLGNMGRGMCKNIIDKGDISKPLLVFNRSQGRADSFRATCPEGTVTGVATIGDGVHQADVIFTCLSDDEAVESTVASAVDGDVRGKLFIECSTIHPDTTERVGRLVTSRGANFVAAPVFGAPAMADVGQLIGVLAGPAGSVKKAQPFFKGVTSRDEILMSDKPYGNASLLKVLGNTFVLNLVEQLAEAHVVAEKSGLGTEYTHMFVEKLFPGPYVAYSHRMLSGDYHTRLEPLFSVDLARKDARHAKSIAAGSGCSLQNVDTADKHLADVQAHSGAGDMAGIYGAARAAAGLKFENSAFMR